MSVTSAEEMKELKKEKNSLLSVVRTYVVLHTEYTYVCALRHGGQLLIHTGYVAAHRAWVFGGGDYRQQARKTRPSAARVAAAPATQRHRRPSPPADSAAATAVAA